MKHYLTAEERKAARVAMLMAAAAALSRKSPRPAKPAAKRSPKRKRPA